MPSLRHPYLSSVVWISVMTMLTESESLPEQKFWLHHEPPTPFACCTGNKVALGVMHCMHARCVFELRNEARGSHSSRESQFPLRRSV